MNLGRVSVQELSSDGIVAALWQRSTTNHATTCRYENRGRTPGAVPSDEGECAGRCAKRVGQLRTIAERTWPQSRKSAPATLTQQRQYTIRQHEPSGSVRRQATVQSLSCDTPERRGPSSEAAERRSSKPSNSCLYTGAYRPDLGLLGQPPPLRVSSTAQAMGNAGSTPPCGWCL